VAEAYGHVAYSVLGMGHPWVTDECWLKGEEVFCWQFTDKGTAINILSGLEKPTLIYYISFIHCSIITTPCIINTYLAFRHSNKPT
jgi:hypothetical protein